MRSGLDRSAWAGWAILAMRITMIAACGTMVLAGCSTKPARTAAASSSGDNPRTGGGYYQDDGPGRNPPANLDQIPDAVPRWEPLHRFANRPYTVLGRDYVPATEHRPYRERGTASWYGRKFHQQKTSIGEVYDMYAMTAAHPTLPLPSYARVTNLANGRSVIVRVNDRGPFLHDRIIDLSYAAAQKLGYLNQGSARVEVEALVPEGGGVIATRPVSAPAVASAPLPPVASAVAAAMPLPPVSIAGGAAGATAAAGAMGTAGTMAATSATSATSTTSTTSTAAPPPLPLRIEGTAIWIQLGAFSTLENAENFLSVIEFQLAGEGPRVDGKGGNNTQAPRVRSRDNLFRVELGPYSTRDEAQRTARELESRFDAHADGRVGARAVQ